MNTNQWHSLYLTSNVPFNKETSAHVAEHLKQQVQDLGYTLYNPFGIIPGKSYPQAVRAFVAPPQATWIRIIAESPLPDALIQAISADYFVLSLTLNEDDNHISAYQNGQPVTVDVDTLRPYLKADADPNDLDRALNTPDITVLPPENTPQPQVQQVVLPLDALPPEIQAMAKDLNPKDTSNMFQKMMRNLGKGNDPTQDEKTKQLMKQAQGLDWNTPHAAQIRLLMQLLNTPDTWRKPDYVALRDAYSLHQRRQRRPNATLYPGDAEAMQAVPDALDYHPIFAGKVD